MIAVTYSMPPRHAMLMTATMRRAAKRRIPKIPGKTRCSYTFEVDGEIVLMKVDCSASCDGKHIRKEICWASLVRAISSTALPDRIMLCGKRTVICDRILVSLIRNASLLVRRIETRMEELKRIGGKEHSREAGRLSDLVRAILYDVPQLISRDFDSGAESGEGGGGKGCARKDDFEMAGEILSRKSDSDLSGLGTTVSDRMYG
jgi:hypothetical protein